MLAYGGERDGAVGDDRQRGSVRGMDRKAWATFDVHFADVGDGVDAKGRERLRRELAKRDGGRVHRIVFRCGGVGIAGRQVQSSAPTSMVLDVATEPSAARLVRIFT